jgi:hypothetical protein
LAQGHALDLAPPPRRPDEQGAAPLLRVLGVTAVLHFVVFPWAEPGLPFHAVTAGR